MKNMSNRTVYWKSERNTVTNQEFESLITLLKSSNSQNTITQPCPSNSHLSHPYIYIYYSIPIHPIHVNVITH